MMLLKINRIINFECIKKRKDWRRHQTHLPTPSLILINILGLGKITLLIIIEAAAAVAARLHNIFIIMFMNIIKNVLSLSLSMCV